MDFRIAVLASGRGSNFLALHAAIERGAIDARLVGVFSDRRHAPVLEHARGLGIPAQSLSPRAFADRVAFDLAMLNAVDGVQPDLIVCAGYMRVIAARALHGRSQRMINIHPSLLPRHRGLHTHQRALEAGDAEHGASVHFVTAELDGGPVIAQARVAVLAGDDADSLAARVLGREHPLLCATVAQFAQRRLALHDGVVTWDGWELPAPLQLGADDVLRLPA